MAFAKLDDKGKGRFFSRDEYLRCLDFLWRELENHYSEKDVCVPILGAGTTSFDGGSGASISQQDLLDIMILYVYSIGAFIGKNASGKTTALELLDCCYDILGKFSLENKHYSYEGIKLEIIFFHEGYIYKYATELKDPLLQLKRH